jgi:hypothetical protein
MLSSSRKSRVGTRVQLALAAAAVGASSVALAANEVVFDPRVEVAAVYDDNYRLTDQPGQEISVSGASIDAQLGISSQDQRSQFGITPRITSAYFPNATSEDATDYYLSGIAEGRTQRTITGIRASYADESVVNSELVAADFPGVDLGQTVSGDTGRVSIRNRRALVIANPYLQYYWTERRTLSLTAQYTDTRYDQTFFEQIGYKDYAGTAGITWNVSQRDKLSLIAIGDRYAPDNSDTDTTTGGVVGEFRREYSQVAEWYVRAGAQHSSRDAFGATPKLSTTAFNGGVGAVWTFQATRVLFDLLRATSPSGAGSVVTRDEVRFRLTHDFQPRFTGFMSARGVHTDALDNGVSTVRERKYATGTFGAEWHMNREYSLHGAYDYTWQKFQGEPNDAVSNGVSLSVIYEPRRLKN